MQRLLLTPDADKSEFLKAWNILQHLELLRDNNLSTEFVDILSTKTDGRSDDPDQDAKIYIEYQSFICSPLYFVFIYVTLGCI